MIHSVEAIRVFSEGCLVAAFVLLIGMTIWAFFTGKW